MLTPGARKEAGTRVVWTGSRVLREDYGDYPRSPDLRRRDGIPRRLAPLLFDWQVSRDIWPSKPTETEARQGILTCFSEITPKETERRIAPSRSAALPLGRRLISATRRRISPLRATNGARRAQDMSHPPA